MRGKTVLMAGLSLLILVVPAMTQNGHAAGTYFDHIVIIAMENKDYSSVLGNGTGTSAAPFLASMLPYSSTIPNYHSYAPQGGSRDGCSAACYTEVTSGGSYGVSDGVGEGSVTATSIFDRITSAGLTWKGFCESGCGRSGDHYPPLQYASTYKSPNSIVTSSDFPGNSQLLSVLNSANPPNYVWLTPTDGHNMHSSSISTGDTYLKTLLVGSGTLTSPAADSLLSTNIFRPSERTLLYIWWDEYDPSPNVEYGPGIARQGYIAPANNYDEYASLHTIVSNWGLSCLAEDCHAPVMSDLFSASSPPSSPPGGISLGWIVIGVVLAVVIAAALVLSVRLRRLRATRASGQSGC